MEHKLNQMQKLIAENQRLQKRIKQLEQSDSNLSEKACIETEDSYRVLSESSAQGILVADLATRHFLYANPRICQMFGYTHEELLALGVSDIHPKEALEQVVSEFEAQARGEKLLAASLPCLRKDGSVFYADITTASAQFQGRNCNLGFFTDITERMETENKIVQTKNLMSAIVKSLPGVFYLFDHQGRMNHWNKNMEVITQYSAEEIRRMNALDFVAPEDRNTTAKKIEQVFVEGESIVESSLVTKDGSKIPFFFTGIKTIIDGQPVLVGVGLDISDRARAEEERLNLEKQIQKAQRLESLGVLAGGIAHDFNNFLVGICGNADLALLDLPPESPVRSHVEDILQAALHLSELTTQMLAYSGKGRFVVTPLNLSEMVKELAHLLEVSISKKVSLHFDLDPNLPVVDGDASQIRQVIMNLITNASEAIGDQEGTIHLCTTGFVVDQRVVQESDFLGELSLGEYVLLEVSDKGCGMDQGTLEKIFQPFFTTKFTGRGLGLAAVLGIMRGHKGGIHVCSELEQGSRFRLLFPCSRSEVKLDEQEASTPPQWQGQLILLVDDEETVRVVGRKMLEKAGCEVLVAEDGKSAVETFRKYAAELCAVILDLTMPKMDGIESIRHLREIRDDVPILLCSGYDEQDTVQQYSGQHIAGFIHKPFRYETLMNKLQEVLSSADQS